MFSSMPPAIRKVQGICEPATQMNRRLTARASHWRRPGIPETLRPCQDHRAAAECRWRLHRLRYLRSYRNLVEYVEWLGVPMQFVTFAQPFHPRETGIR